MAQDIYYHTPVMSRELIKNLRLKKSGTILDCTVGLGGHAEMLLQELGPQGRLLGIEQDSQALEIAQERLKTFENCILKHSNFRDLDQVLIQEKIEALDGVVFDLGVSSLQLNSVERGFSIKMDGPLDMRMDKASRLSAFDLVNFLPQEGLADIFARYGEERWHNRLARAIVWERKKAMIVSTRQLADLIARVSPSRERRIHPATRVFQALRIAVNDELEALRQALVKCIDFIKPRARVCVISFHSLEDRIVKHQFRAFARSGILKIITKKPLRPTSEEVSSNPRSRSAKLRVAEKI